MKWLLILVAVFGGLMWLKRQRSSSPPPDTFAPSCAPAPAAVDPALMVACAHCGTHLPLSDAIEGPGGRYCSNAHAAIGPQ